MHPTIARMLIDSGQQDLERRAAVGRRSARRRHLPPRRREARP